MSYPVKFIIEIENSHYQNITQMAKIKNEYNQIEYFFVDNQKNTSTIMLVNDEYQLNDANLIKIKGHINSLYLKNNNLSYSVGNKAYVYQLDTTHQTSHTFEKLNNISRLYTSGMLLYAFDKEKHMIENSDGQTRTFPGVKDVQVNNNRVYLMYDKHLDYYNLDMSEKLGTINFSHNFQEFAVYKQNIYYLDNNGDLYGQVLRKQHKINITTGPFKHLFALDNQLYLPVKGQSKIEVYEQKRG